MTIVQRHYIGDESLKKLANFMCPHALFLQARPHIVSYTCNMLKY